jgi:hypothetical protein
LGSVFGDLSGRKAAGIRLERLKAVETEVPAVDFKQEDKNGIFRHNIDGFDNRRIGIYSISIPLEEERALSGLQLGIMQHKEEIWRKGLLN